MLGGRIGRHAAVRRQLADRLSTDVSYTWSRFEGNFDLDYSTVAVFNTSSFIQDAPGTNVEDPNRFGPLGGGSSSCLQVFAAYQANDSITASTLLPRSKRKSVGCARPRLGRCGAELPRAGGQSSESHVGESRSDGGVPAAASGRARVSLEARLLNVFNNQTRLQIDAQKYLDLRQIPTPPYFAPY
jgi:hypothetical protein